MTKFIVLSLIIIFSLNSHGENKAILEFQDFTCTIYNTSPEQGDIIIIKVTPRNNIIPQKVRIDDDTDLFFMQFRNHYISVFGLDFRIDPGDFSIKLYIKKDNKISTHDIKVNYGKRNFDRWTLPGTIPRARTRTPEEIQRREKEVQSIYSSLRPITPKLYILDGFTKPIKDSKTSEYRAFGQIRLRDGQEVSRHRGVDISRPRGTPIHAPMSGKVVLIAKDYFFEGHTLIIDNGLGIFNIFCHLDSFAVEEGDLVARGDIIGFVGSTGRATGPHLHWQIKFLLKDINPLSFYHLNQLIKDIK